MKKKCRYCKQLVKKPYYVCDRCLINLDVIKLRRHIKKQLIKINIYKRIPYHTRIEMENYNYVVNMVDRYAKALVDKLCK